MPEDFGREGLFNQVLEWTQDTAALVADWHHFAILELTRLEEFQADSRWIARVLGISVDDVSIALQRLLRLGLMEMSGRNRWIDRSGEASLTLLGFMDAAVTRLFEQTRKLAADAIPDTRPGLAEFASTTVAVDTKRIPAAVERLARFGRELLDFLRSGDGRDDVYRLELSLFPVTQLNREGEPDGKRSDALADHHQES